MNSTIQKWGNSSAIRLPKPLLNSVNLKVHDTVTLIVSGEDIIIRKATSKPEHKTLEQRLLEAGLPAGFIIEQGDLDDSSVGDEVFW